MADGRVEALDFGNDSIALVARRRRDPGGAALCGAAHRCPACRRRPNSAPSSTRISASSRRPTSRRSSACSTTDRMAVRLPRPALGHDQRRRPAASTRRARRWRRRSGARSQPSPGLPPDLPPWQIVRERRATFAATPEQDARRPGAEDRLAQSGPGRRLDRYRLARHDRKCHPVRATRRRISWPQAVQPASICSR